MFDFSQLKATDVAYSSGSDHDTVLLEPDLNGIGLYKYCYYASRQVGSTGVYYGPVLWKGGISVNGRNDAVKTSAPETLPAIITPKFANGIKMIIVEGWGNGKQSSMFLSTEGSDGKWVSPKGKGILADDNHYYVTLSSNAIVPDTIKFITKNIKTVKLNRQDQPYVFITKITVVPNESHDGPVTSLYETEMDDKTRKVIVNGQLYIVCESAVYNVQGQMVK